MKLRVPIWAADVENDNILVLLWFMKRIALKYPETKEKKSEKPEGDRIRRVTYHSCYNFYPSDIRAILQTKLDFFKQFKKAGIENYIELGLLTSESILVKMQLQQETIDLEISDPLCIELVCYLSGCLNSNLIETNKPVRHFMLDRAVRKRWNWQEGRYEKKKTKSDTI